MNKTLFEIALLFLKLGATAFGGPAAHIALMEQEVVRRRGWLTHEHFLDLIGATNLIPGPNSTEMTMHVGYERAGWRGLFVAGICFILPAALITLGFAMLYKQYGTLPEVAPFFLGIQAAVIAIILQAVYNLAKKAVKNIPVAIIGVVALASALLGVNEITAVLGGGVLAVLWFQGKRLFQGSEVKHLLPVLLFQAGAVLPLDFSLGKLFFVFLKVGALLFGSGYVLVAYLEDELVTKLHWLTQSQLLDAVAIGQFTPGPLFTTSTFIGYQLGGLSGAAVATLGIFLPAFLFVWLLNPLVPRMRRSRVLGFFLDGVNIAAVAVMLAAVVQLGSSVVQDWRSILIGVVSLFILLRYPKVNTMWIVIGSAISGWILALL
ncbi:MAG: chromate efflux transporter [Saprospiraceae bacterium]